MQCSSFSFMMFSQSSDGAEVAIKMLLENVSGAEAMTAYRATYGRLLAKGWVLKPGLEEDGTAEFAVIRRRDGWPDAVYAVYQSDGNTESAQLPAAA